MTLFFREHLAAQSILRLIVMAGVTVPFGALRVEAQINKLQNAIHVAQNYGRPPGDVGEGGDALGDQTAGPQDPAGLLVRLGKLESQMRQINGQIEQMQFETRRLEETLRKFQEDVDFRLREGTPRAPATGSSQKRGEAAEPQINGNSRTSAEKQSPAVAASGANRHGDAFDPSQDPAAPGVPRKLGSLASDRAGQGPDESDQTGAEPPEPGAPLDLTNGHSKSGGEPPPAPASSPATAAVGAHGATAAAGTAQASPPATPRRQFDLAMAYLKQAVYENAEKGFADFLEKNPKDKLAPDAIYYLGESYYLRGRRREAAEQFLKVSTQYANSPRAPQALLRLGESLRSLGAKEQACATFNEIARKYPDASAMIKTSAEHEAKRTPC